MIDQGAYTKTHESWRMLPRSCFFVSLLLFFLFVSIANIHAQNTPVYDEIPVFLEIQGVGGFEIDAIIMGEELFLPVTELFDFLKIRNIPSPGLETISGFFINPEAQYTINQAEKSIKYQDQIFNLEEGDLIKTETNLYLKSIYFGKIFGIDCFFNFRSLSAKLTSKLELPIIRAMKQEELRKNLSRLQGELKTDTNIRRTYPLFRFGMADWAAYSSSELNGRNDLRINLNLGSMIAGGEATGSFTYSNNENFSEKQQYYQWRYVDNDFKIFRQAILGKITTRATSSIFNPVLGVQFTNTPTTYRRSFGTYPLSDRTEPGWIVELFVNHVLVDYTKADASGFFKFEVPLVYGNSIIQLKYYGPWGEEKVHEQNITIPFNFLPEKTFEYKVSAGLVEDSTLSRFSRIDVGYGVSRKISVGGGMEYLSSVKSGPAMPFMNASWSLLNNVLFSAEYMYGVRTKGTLSYHTPSNIQFDLNYTKYDPDQEAIFYNYLEERKASIALPIRLKHFSSYNRLAVYQIVLPSSDYITGEWMFSGSFLGINTNITTYALFVGNAYPYVYTNLSGSLRLPAGFVIMPQAQYTFSNNEFISAKLAIEKRIKDKAFMNLSYERNFTNDLNMAEIGFRYNFSFAQTGASVRHGSHNTAFTEYARGSLIYDRKTNFLGTDNQTNVGRGGISVIPFVDVNGNGIREEGEPKAYELNLRTNGGSIEKSESDTTIRILGLEPYTNCYIELDDNSFENISWRLPVKIIGVTVDPNILKHIEIPVSVVGEAIGTVNIIRNGEKNGLGRIIVNFFNQQKKLVGSTLTEDDGYFSWFGLVPGYYTAMVDSMQLKKLKMAVDPGQKAFVIRPGEEGDVADHIDFNLMIIPSDSTKERQKMMQPVVKKDTTIIIVHEITQEVVTISKDSWAIQLGAFRNKANGENLRRRIEKLISRKVDIIIENNYYKVRIDQIETRDSVDRIIGILQDNGFSELWLISLKAHQEQLIIREVQDSVITVRETKFYRVYGKDFYKINRNVPLFKTDVLNIMGKNPSLKTPVISDLRSVSVSFNNNGNAFERVVPVMKIQNVINIPAMAIPLPEVPLIKPEPSANPARLMIIPDKPAETKPAEAAVESKPVPGISIQVAVFYKKSEAVRVQRKISSKLGLPVEIEQQWEFFRVIIPGFYTREETYRYYPELAGLGFPGITIIEKK